MKLSFLFYEPISDLIELSRRMARLVELGFQGVELTASHPPPYPPEALLELSERHRLRIVSFLSGWSYGHEKLCLASPDPDVRRRAAERLMCYIDYAAPLHALVVIGLMQGLRSDEPDETVAIPRIAEGLRRAADHAAQKQGRLILEPVNHLQVGFHHTAAAAAALVDRVGSPGLGYMLDTIHLHIEERSVIETIRRHGGRIEHFHLCESNGGLFGTGAIDFCGVLGALQGTGYDRFISVKVYRDSHWEDAARQAAETVLPLITAPGRNHV
ncbi:MAG: sugar phosphate isomerase/epimerase family protein [Planctomycetales bacterium]